MRSLLTRLVSFLRRTGDLSVFASGTKANTQTAFGQERSGWERNQTASGQCGKNHIKEKTARSPICKLLFRPK